MGVLVLTMTDTTEGKISSHCQMLGKQLIPSTEVTEFNYLTRGVPLTL